MGIRGGTLLLLLICGFASPATAELYRWTDAQGRVHMTDDLSQVPPSQRAAAEQAAKGSDSKRRSGWNSIRVQSPAHSTPAAPAPSASKTANRYEIPVERAGTSIRVGARLNGTQVAPFKVDTGAEINMVPRWVVDRMGITLDDKTPTMSVVGISGKPMQLPIVRFDEVSLGGASVRNVEMVVNPSSNYGLLGMTFFNHFRVQTDPLGGRLILEEVDLDGAEGVYGGFGEGYWRKEFRILHKQLVDLQEYRESVPSTHVTAREELEGQEDQLRKRLANLHERASRAGVPQSWRE